MNILKLIFSSEFAFSILRLTTPILIATLAAIISERAGVTNMGIEGTMLFGSLFGVVGSAFFQNAWMGLLCAMLGGAVISLIISYFSLKLDADVTLAGIAINLVASGGTVFILYLVSGDRGMSSSLLSKVLPSIDIPLIKNIPILGEIISGHNILTYIGFLLVIATHILLFRTPLGLQIRAVGENPDAASSVGVSKVKIQTTALVLCGLLSGMAGAYMSMGYLSMFNRNMVAGRGYIALAASSVGNLNPIGGMLSSLLFGVLESLANNIQQLNIPVEIIQTIPYAATIIFFGISSYRKLLENKRKTPGKESKPH